MSRKFIFSVLAFCALKVLNAQAPAAVFVNAIGSSSDDQGRNCVADGSGNVIVIGRFAGTEDFDPSGVTQNLVSAGSDDIFVAKYTSAGALSWAFKIGAGNSDSGEGVTVDGSDNVYITGRFNGTADFNPGVGTNNLTATGGDDIFVAKYSSLGVYQWAFKVGSASDDQGRAISFDATNNVYVTGRLGAVADFDPSAGTTNVTPTGNDDVFVAKYSSAAGAFVWAFKIGGANDDSGEGLSADGSGNVYVTGYFQGTADFDPSGSTANQTSAGNDDIFMAKYNSAGTYQWAFKIGSANGDQGRNIVYSTVTNAIFLTGYFTGTADFNPSGSTNNITSNGNDDAFVARFNTAGAYQWAFKIGSAGGDERGEGITVDFNGNVYVSGRLTNTADFDPSASTANLTSSGSNDIYLAEYANGGAYQMAFKVGGASDDRAAGVTVDGSGNMFITGLFHGGAMDFDPTAATVNRTSNSSSDDIFIAKYNTTVFLPITFTGFSAVMGDNGVNVNWSTATEKNNDQFTVERSKDGLSFEAVTFVKGAGNSSSLIEYSEVDYSPLPGISYYRIKQTDFDGKSAYSDVLAVNLRVNDEGMFVFPNPTSGAFTINLKGIENREILVVIRDITGKEYFSKVVVSNEEGHLYAIDPENILPSGSYVVVASSYNKLYSQKLIVK